ncbi:unnamed protein product [Danaus chrysippus]|uniref:(African queen) hypothetical protein n=1 Tax=Danaus chrysippus TaxID=151541 RepID=A0A8J2R3J1_9NEOP|nr:unnamed protein product [Danaus chrysippus]
MFVNIYVSILLAFLVYCYVNHNNEFNATASVIQQIWSGDCRLSCRQSENSGISGLSGLRQGVFQESTLLLDRDRPGPSACVCDTCPCAVLEKILIICSPVRNLYSQLIDLMSSYYCDFVTMVTDMLSHLEQIAHCGATCRRQSRLTSLKLDSAENINFTNSTAVRKDSLKANKDLLNIKQSAISFRKKSEDELKKIELRSSTGAHDIAVNLPTDNQKTVSESGESISSSKNCSKCIEKGKCMPLGDPSNYCDYSETDSAGQGTKCSLCDVYLLWTRLAKNTARAVDFVFRALKVALYQTKLKIFFAVRSTNGLKAGEEAVDEVIEDEITHKLGEDLIQSLERKFQVDLERSMDMVLTKIKLLLQNGTQHIQDKLAHIQETLNMMKVNGENQVESCLSKKQNETSGLAEKALHQMVVCGYALIGQDPGQAVRKVALLKNMIGQGIKPLLEQKKEIYRLLKVCGHDHDSLKKVIKCVISKSPLIKSTMMEISGKLIDGVVDLTKLMAHGAMHEACLIEVIKTIEDEASELVKEIGKCAFGDTNHVVDNFINENNATILDVYKKYNNGTKVPEMQEMLTKMLRGEQEQREEIQNQFLNLKSEDTNVV